MEWNEEKAQEIVQKHKNRFSIKLTLQIIRILVLLAIFFVVYKIVLSILYDSTTFGKRTEFYQKLAVDWTYPDLSTDLGLSHSNEITTFLTQNITIPLERTVGNKKYIVEELTVKKPLITAFTSVEMNNDKLYKVQDGQFNFHLPVDPMTGKKLEGEDFTEAWRTLDKLHEGNVANLAFSFNDYKTPEEVIEQFKTYDLHILWLPLYMGEYQSFTEGGWSGGTDTMSLSRTWGLSGAREMDKDFLGGWLVHTLNEETVDDSKKIMLENMKEMLRKSKKVAETLLGTNHLEERTNYLQREGFQAYGAVVTGPVKELLKLQEIDNIRSVQLGEITHWNWEKE